MWAQGHRDELGRVIVFDASDTSIPDFYRTAVGSTGSSSARTQPIPTT